MKSIAVLIPGIMGSVLKLGSDVIWPGSVGSLVLPYDKMAELMRPELVATDCIRSFVLEQYQALIDDLAVCHFREADQTLIVAAYDWRKNNDLAAMTLADKLDKAAAIHAGDVEIHLIAHSMGGLISRYYLESGQFTNRAAFAKVRQLITLATPHGGAAVALPVVLGMEKRLFLNKDQVLQLASDPRYPAAYQLLPRPREPFAWDGASQAGLHTLDIYDPAVAAKLNLIPANLKAASDFQASLDYSKRPAHVRYFCFSGTRQTTASHVRILPRNGGVLTAMKIDQDDAGDGTVPIWSSALPLVQSLYVGGEHGTIYKNSALRSALASLLGWPGVLAGAPKGVEVSIRDKVVEPGDPVHVVLSFFGNAGQVDGRLNVERARIGNVPPVQFDPANASYPIHYQGLDAETLATVFDAPSTRGHYRVAFYLNRNPQVVGFDELIVQDPAP